MLVIDLLSRVPIYEQIKNQIMELIVVGALKPNDMLPSIRALASQLALNFNTVKKAFQDLEADGVLYTVVGRGTFVAEGAMSSDHLRNRAIERFKSELSVARASGLTEQQVSEMVAEAYANFRRDVQA
ncbi:MAG: GntR family transcriptional regulator [Saccharofermentanales bacterium]|jgi:GntR family transcriptional regulator|nr:GntR family transcriptional regulator [Clostridiaceae bacterium]